jgi:hypothetical protein
VRPKDKLFASECVSIGALEMLKNSFEKGIYPNLSNEVTLLRIMDISESGLAKRYT